MADEKKTNDELKKELIRLTVIAGVTTSVGAICYAIGHAKGSRLMTPDEHAMRVKIFDAKKDGQAVMHWVGPKGDNDSFLIKYLAEGLAKK